MNINKPLLGKTILSTRPSAKALELAQAIEAEGGRCLIVPSIEIAPVKVSSNIDITSDIFIFVSQYAVQYAPLELLVQLQKQETCVIAVGEATAAALQKVGVLNCIRPEEPSSEGLLALPELQNSKLKGKSIIIFRGKSGRMLLDKTLAQRGAKVNAVIVYERILPKWTPKEYELLKTDSIDLILGLSVDSLTYFFSQLDLPLTKRFLNVPWLVMSHRVAEEAKKLGITTVYTVFKGDIFKSLIQCCSPATISSV